MTKLNKKSNLLVVMLIFVSYFLIPFIGIQLNYSNSSIQAKKDTINLESMPFSSISEFNTNSFNLERHFEAKYAKFDLYLNQYLANLTLNKNKNLENIQITILFEDFVNKKERLEILDSIFDDYKFIRNYDIISGTYIKINPIQLINNEREIDEIKSIKKIYKSKFYQNPYIIEENHQTTSLNSEDYPNWWLSAVGAEDLPYNGSGVKVAVIDTGMYNHPDLNIINNSNFVTNESWLNYNDDVGHGTHVGGIIAGDGGGSSGKYRGIAPGAYLINARAGNASGLSDFDIINAIEWSSYPISMGGAGADIITLLAVSNSKKANKEDLDLLTDYVKLEVTATSGGGSGIYP